MELVTKYLVRASVLAFALSATAIHAAPGGPKTAKVKTDPAAAKKAYLAAQKLFKAEEYKLALPLFEKSLSIVEQKAFFDYGTRAMRANAEMYDEAIGHFKEYMAVAPSKDRKKRIQETLRILEQQNAQLKKEQAAEEEKKKLAEAEAEKIRKKEAELLAEKLAAKIVQQQVPSATKEESKDSIWGSPWLWVGIGVVVAGAAAGTSVALSGSDSDLYGGSSGVLLTPQ